jgi:hypothetical protein
MKRNTDNYNITCRLVGVENSVSHTKDRTYVDYVWEWSAEENIWT